MAPYSMEIRVNTSRRDRTIQRATPSQNTAARAAILRFFERNGALAFHFRAVQVALENKFAETTVRRAIHDLLAQGELRTTTGQGTVADAHLDGSSENLDIYALCSAPPEHGGDASTAAKVLWRNGMSDPERAVRRSQDLIAQFSCDAFTRALGDHAEHLLAKALGQIGGRLEVGNGRGFAGVQVDTALSLDEVFSNAHGQWGFEVKNQLVSPNAQEVFAKLELCEQLGLAFVLVARFVAPPLRDRLLARGAGVMTFSTWRIPRSFSPLAAQLDAHAYPVHCQKDPDPIFREQLEDAMAAAWRRRIRASRAA